MKLLVLLLYLFIGKVSTKEWLPPSNIHRKLFRLHRKLSVKKNLAFRISQKECKKAEPLSPYYCYIAAKLAFKKKLTNKGLALLTISGDKLDANINLFKLHSSSIAPLNKKLRYYEKTLRAAKQNNYTQVIMYLTSAYKAGFKKPDVLINHPLLRKYKGRKKYDQLINKMKSQYTFLISKKRSPLNQIIDVNYDFKRHQLHPNPQKIMFQFYNAVNAAKKKKVELSNQHFISFFNNLIDLKNISNNEKRELFLFAASYVWKNKKLLKVIKGNSFLDWFEDKSILTSRENKWLIK